MSTENKNPFQSHLDNEKALRKPSKEQYIKISKTKLEVLLSQLNKADIKSDAAWGKINLLESILSEGQPVEQISDEDIECSCCGSNDNHLQRVCHKCRNKWAVDINTPDEWLTDKPAFNKECLFVTAHKFWKNDYKYYTWRLVKSKTEDTDYLELFAGNGDETKMSIEDLAADYYKIISPINKAK